MSLDGCNIWHETHNPTVWSSKAGHTFLRFYFLAPCCALSALLRGDQSSTCVCLRLREQCLRSKITSVSRVAHVLLLRSVTGYRGSKYAGVQAFPVDRKHSNCSKAQRNPQKLNLCVLAFSSCREYAETQECKVRPVAGFRT